MAICDNKPESCFGLNCSGNWGACIYSRPESTYPAPHPSVLSQVEDMSSSMGDALAADSTTRRASGNKPGPILDDRERACCRMFASRGISKEDLSQHYRCSNKTIWRVINNSYGDDTDKDCELVANVPNFDEILKKLLANKARAAKRTREPVQDEQSKMTTRSYSRPGVAARSSSSSNNTPARATTAAFDDTHLRDFLSKVGLNGLWLENFKKAGLTAQRLNDFARTNGTEEARTKRITQFVSDTFPDMNKTDRFFLVEKLMNPF
ncbi:hypothetical protein R3P38DRAFT_3040225 [Favolaschia claudopus]|uniref:Uncharacterized protein n=1 Tax=Favolaschia claudopus TaxID=2862362 RepID=A0AAW0AAP7_9AGAR